jgi:hypothetical protein
MLDTKSGKAPSFRGGHFIAIELLPILRHLIPKAASRHGFFGQVTDDCLYKFHPLQTRLGFLAVQIVDMVSHVLAVPTPDLFPISRKVAAVVRFLVFHKGLGGWGSNSFLFCVAPEGWHKQK